MWIDATGMAEDVMWEGELQSLWESNLGPLNHSYAHTPTLQLSSIVYVVGVDGGRNLILSQSLSRFIISIPGHDNDDANLTLSEDEDDNPRNNNNKCNTRNFHHPVLGHFLPPPPAMTLKMYSSHVLSQGLIKLPDDIWPRELAYPIQCERTLNTVAMWVDVVWTGWPTVTFIIARFTTAKVPFTICSSTRWLI